MFDKIIGLFKHNPLREAKPHYERGLAYNDDYDNAIPEFEKAIRLKPDYGDAYFTLGQALYKRGSYEQAIRKFDKAVQFGPENAEALVGRGLAYEAKGDVEAAIADYDRAIEIKPDACSNYLLRAMARDKKGQAQGAASDYTRVLELSSDPDLRRKVQDRLRSLGVNPSVRPPAQPAPAQAPRQATAASSPAISGATPPPVQAYVEARNSILALDAAAAGMSPSKEAPNVWGVAIDIGLPEAVATLVSLSNGTTCLYLGNGGSTMDEGQNGAVVAASRALIVEVERWYKGMTSTASFPLPAVGMVKFYVMTFSGAFAADAVESELARGEHKLSPLFHSSQEVLTQLQRSKAQK